MSGVETEGVKSHDEVTLVVGDFRARCSRSFANNGIVLAVKVEQRHDGQWSPHIEPNEDAQLIQLRKLIAAVMSWRSGYMVGRGGSTAG